MTAPGYERLSLLRSAAVLADLAASMKPGPLRFAVALKAERCAAMAERTAS